MTTLNPPLISRVLAFPNPVLRILTQIALGIILIALLAQFEVHVGPVPISGQTLGVLLVGAAYGFSLGSLTVFLYLMVGGLGLGVFSGGAAGWAVFTGSTAGYLVGFVIAAGAVGYLAQRGWDRRFSTTALAMLIGNILIYVPGLLWLNRLAPDWSTTLAWGLTPFIVGDIVKLLLAATALPLAWTFFPKR